LQGLYVFPQTSQSFSAYITGQAHERELSISPVDLSIIAKLNRIFRKNTFRGLNIKELKNQKFSDFSKFQSKLFERRPHDHEINDRQPQRRGEQHRLFCCLSGLSRRGEVTCSIACLVSWRRRGEVIWSVACLVSQSRGEVTWSVACLVSQRRGEVT
jgi:hypothetical protein